MKVSQLIHYAHCYNNTNSVISADADYTVKGFFGTKTASVDAGADARDTAAAFNLVSSTTGVKATAITRARITASAAATFTFTFIGKSTTASNCYRNYFYSNN